MNKNDGFWLDRKKAFLIGVVLIIVLMGTGVYRTIEAHAYVGKHLKRQCVAIGEKTWT